MNLSALWWTISRKSSRNNHLDRDAIIDKMAKIRLQISPDRFVTLSYIFQNIQWLSSDPEASMEARWGLDKCSMIAINLKSAQQSISFIQRNTARQIPLLPSGLFGKNGKSWTR